MSQCFYFEGMTTVELGVVKIRNTEEAVIGHNTPLTITMTLGSIVALGFIVAPLLPPL